MATLSLKKASLVTRGHHVEVVAVGPHKIGYRASLRGLTFFSPLWGHTLKKKKKKQTQDLGTGLALGALPLSVHSGDIPIKMKNNWVQG